MLRCIFLLPIKACKGDYRPRIWPIRYPYWFMGYTDREAEIVAYVKDMDEFFMQWPEMERILDKRPSNAEFEICDEIGFSDRFPRPVWYTEEHIHKMSSVDNIKDIENLMVSDLVERNRKNRMERFIEKFGHWWYLRDLDFLPEPCEEYPKAFKMDGRWKEYGWAVFDSIDKAREACNRARIAVGLGEYDFK